MRTNSLSKVIKSYEDDALLKVKKFEKKAFKLPANRKALANEQTPSSSQTVGQSASGRSLLENDFGDEHPQAEQVIAKAQKEADNIRKQAREQGYADGFAKGKEENQKEFEEMSQASQQVIASLVSQLKEQEKDMMRLLSPRLADLAMELARRIIHREIKLDQSIVVGQAKEAITKILEREKLIIRVNPREEKTMKAQKPVLMSLFDGIDKIEVVADQTVERGGCVVETNLVKVDAQPESQLQSARKALVTDSPSPT
jgi:flagellar assembly protein FliH